MPADFVTAQIDAVFSDLEVGAVKIGMVAQAASIDAIAAALSRWAPRHIVLDPVMVATSGDRLLAAEAVEALRRKLMPLASVITPNLPEAAALLDEPVATSEAEIESQGARLLALGCRAVLIKGGHGEGAESIDYLVEAEGHDRACGAARRHPQHPRHRLLAVLGGRGGACQGRGSRAGRAQRQGLDQRSDRGRRPLQRRPRPRADPSFPQILLIRAAQRRARTAAVNQFSHRFRGLAEAVAASCRLIVACD